MPGGTAITSGSPSAPWRWAPCAVAAALGAEVRAPAEALQVAQVVVAAQHDVAAAAAVAAVRPALGHVRLAPEREAAVAARAGADLDARAVVEHPAIVAEGELRASEHARLAGETVACGHGSCPTTRSS